MLLGPTCDTLVTVRIDAHHHVWDLTVRDQSWISGDRMAPIRRNFGIDELGVEASAAGISGTIVVQTVAEVEETEELLDLAADAPLVVGVVGYVDLAAPNVGDQLDRLLARTSGSWLVAIRSLVQDEPDPAWLQRPAVISGLRHVAQRGLAYDLLIRPTQLDAAVRAVTEVPDGRFVVDHLAKPAIADLAWEPWATGFAALAERDNVSAKLSGMVTEARWESWTTDDLRPYVDHALATFGPDRLMFGSDWPVCTLAATYARVVAVAEHLLAELSIHERTAILGGTAEAVYGDRNRRRAGRMP